MKKNFLLPLVSLAAGAAAAVLRGLQLSTGYEPVTGLPIAGNLYWFALIGLCAVFLIAAFYLSRSYLPYEGRSFEHMFHCKARSYKLIGVLACAVLLLSGATGFLTTLFSMDTNIILQSIPMLALWMLAAVSGAALIGLMMAQSRIHINESSALCTIIPMFWACFDLIITFRDNGASPVLSMYAFDLLAAMSMMYAFYTMASFLYSTGHAARFSFFSSISCFLTIMTVGGYLVAGRMPADFTGNPVNTLLRYACFTACTVFLTSNLFVMQSNAAYIDSISVIQGLDEPDEEE